MESSGFSSSSLSTPSATSRAPSLSVVSGSLHLPSRPAQLGTAPAALPPLPDPTPPRVLFIRRPRRQAPSSRQGSHGRRSGRRASPLPPGPPAGRR